jgi:uncharacterized repeat protein (TIGR03803 family)
MNAMRTPTTAAWTLALALAAAMISVPPAQAQAPALTFDLLHTFTGAPDGNQPLAGLFRDAKGRLYGTTGTGGDANCPGNQPFGCGTVFTVDASGKYSVLHTFLGEGDGGFPLASLTEDAAGNLYGTTAGLNGAASTVFKLTQAGQKTVLHAFSDQGADGGVPDTTPILDAAGNLYGTTPFYGDSHCGFQGSGCGVIYKVNASGQFSVFHTFASIADGMMPEGGLAMDAKGTLYGATFYGGDLNCYLYSGLGCGTVFRLNKSGKFAVLHRFHGKAGGSIPVSATADAAGNVYGITDIGGDLTCNPPFGCGVIFKIDTAGKFTVLFTFNSKVICCGGGYNILVRDSKGSLYDTTPINGPHNGGFLFELDTTGKFTVLFDFPYQGENGDGQFVNSIVMDAHGNFYGTMQLGGDFSCGRGRNGCGTVFKLTP